jgi:Ca-activated chloride channel family protein
MAKLLGVRVYTIGAVSAPVQRGGEQPESDSVDEQLMRKMAEDTGGQYYSVSDANSLAEVYREIETLEKSHVGSREFVDYEEAHLVFLAAGALLLFIEIALAATIFRRSP